MDLADIKINKKVQIVFMGTPEFAVPVLEGLITSGYKIRAVVCQPDRKKDSDGNIQFPPVKQIAIDNTILVLQPEDINEEYEEILNLEPDLIITCAYGQILPKVILDAPRLGCINVHASLLPKLRGGAPIHKAIIEGYTKTGITIMYMNSKMDAGDIITQEEVEITAEETASSLHGKLKIVGKDLLLKTLPSIIKGTNSRTKQNHAEATYGFTLKREDERIDFKKSKRQIYNQIRGLNSWPGAYCLFKGMVLKVWSSRVTDNHFSGFEGEITALYDDGFGVKVSNGEVVFTEVSLEGKRRMCAADFINGHKEDLVGKVLD